jgi:hypothetical protein
MQIRNLKWRGTAVWPPEWQMLDQGSCEHGILETVSLRKDQIPGFISLSVNDLGESKLGVIILDRLDHLEILFRQLQENIGRPLSEIGDLEIDFAPSRPKYSMKQVRTGDIKRVMYEK